MKKFSRKVAVPCLAFFLLILALICYQYLRPPASLQNVHADLKANATIIANDYAGNEANADSKYLGKVVDISGKVASIKGAPAAGGSTIYFMPNGNDVAVAVELSGQPTEGDFPKMGDSVLIRASCTGYLMDVNFNRGVVLKKY